MRHTLPNLSIDVALFGFIDHELKVLLINRDKEPEKNKWSLPGGLVYLDESTDDAAKRKLEELTGIGKLYLSQVGFFGAVDRYPGERIASILYCALIRPEQYQLIAGSHAKEAQWFAVCKIQQLPFDHNEMIQRAMDWIKDELWRKPIFINLLPEKFPLNQMMNLFSEFLDEEQDNRNFRKKVISQGLVERLEERTSGGVQRPAHLYSLSSKLITNFRL